MNRSLTALAGASRTLDGGAMFGNLPRQRWADWIAPDLNNHIRLASRALLVQEGARNVLVLAGGEELLAPLPGRCLCQRQPGALLESLDTLGLDENDIDFVVLTHLHTLPSADLKKTMDDGEFPRLLFPRARYILGRQHWLRACQPHPRDRALFLAPLRHRLEASGRLQLLDGPRSDALGDGWRFHLSDGHTPGQLLPEIAMPGGPVVFAGDLIPGTHWLPLDVTSGFDRNPESLVGEKERLLDHLVASSGRLFLARDPQVAMIKVMRDRQSRYLPFDQHRTLRRFDC